MPGPSSNSTTNDTKTTTPYDQSQIMAGINAAGGALAQSQANTGTPTGFVAQMTPQQLAMYQSIYGNANAGLPAASSAINSSAPLIGTGAGALSSAISGYGGFDPTKNNNPNALTQFANAYTSGQNIPGEVKAIMQPAVENAQIQSGNIDSNAALSNNTNSSRTGVEQAILQRSLNEQAGNIGTQLTNQANATGAQLGESALQNNNASTLAALTGMYGAGSSAVGGGAYGLASGVNDTGALSSLALQGAGGNQENTQLGYDASKASTLYGETNPFTAASQYIGLVGNNPGGTVAGTSTTNTQSNPGLLSEIGAGVGIAGSLMGIPGMGSLGGMSGGYNPLAGLQTGNSFPGNPYAYGATGSFQNGQWGPMF